jgi:hypothetical protein
VPDLIPRLSATSRDYLAAFDVAAVAISPTGQVYVSHNPVGASLCWWCKAKDAKLIAKAAKATGDVPGTAARYGITLTPHARVLERVQQRTSRIETAIEQALDAGVLKQFNAVYRKRRLEAKRAGRGFMSYSAAQARLRKVVTAMVTRCGLITESLIDGVFGN